MVLSILDWLGQWETCITETTFLSAPEGSGGCSLKSVEQQLWLSGYSTFCQVAQAPSSVGGAQTLPLGLQTPGNSVGSRMR